MNEDSKIFLLMLIASMVFAMVFYSCTTSRTTDRRVKYMTFEITSSNEKADNVTGFVVEKSTDAVKWVNLITIPASGKKKYTYSLPESSGFFRLKINKINGSVYNKVLNVK